MGDRFIGRNAILTVKLCCAKVGGSSNNVIKQWSK
jgi:hypothetical protein